MMGIRGYCTSVPKVTTNIDTCSNHLVQVTSDVLI